MFCFFFFFLLLILLIIFIKLPAIVTLKLPYPTNSSQIHYLTFHFNSFNNNNIINIKMEGLIKGLVDVAIGGADHNDGQEEHGERSWADLVSGDQDQVSDSTMSTRHSHFSSFICQDHVISKFYLYFCRITLVLNLIGSSSTTSNRHSGPTHPKRSHFFIFVLNSPKICNLTHSLIMLWPL